MERQIEKNLIEWKNQKSHLPLLLRGARQVGKTYIVEKFGREQFNDFVSINFELNPSFRNCFDTLDPKRITDSISLITGNTIKAGETLLFLDEIQECPEAIKSLRYFKEMMPNLHIIGAGSLVEFVLNDESFRMPVGRVQFIYLKPLSFKEFLKATNNQQLIQHIEHIHLNDEQNIAIHQHLLKLLREYMALGGMPAVIQEYLDSKNFINCQNLQTVLLNTYRNDFGKYASKTNHKFLQRLYEKAPGLIGQHFKYVNIDQEMRSRDIKVALENLCDAGIINPIYSTTASGLPLNAQKNIKKFKLLFLDVGLVKRATQLDIDILLKENLLLINQGALAEQLVGQEILANSNPFDPGLLFFWTKEKKGSMAEVDYVTTVDSSIIPIEVKSGTTGRLKSLRLFMEEKQSQIGIRISQLPLNLENKILSLPLYMISELKRLVRELTK